jgi:flagellar FliL protein
MADDKAARRGGALRSALIGAPLALLGAGAGFYGVYAGLVPSPGAGAATAAAERAAEGGSADSHGAAHAAAGAETETAHAGAEPVVATAGGALPLDGVYVPLKPILVTVGGRGEARHLQFAAELEVAPGAAAEVEAAMPRTVDVLTTYLRAVSPTDIQDPAAMLRMRAQMLRRVQVVMGEGKVRDLLVAEFVMR